MEAQACPGCGRPMTTERTESPAVVIVRLRCDHAHTGAEQDRMREAMCQESWLWGNASQADNNA